MKRHKNKKWVLRVLIFLCFAVAGLAAIQVVSLLAEYAAGKRAYEALPAPQESSDELAAETSAFTVNFEALAQINPDCKAWLLSEETTLSYPVVQGEDNEYYLDHLFTGEKNSAGCLFLDAANQPDFSDRNSVIYGHAMKNGTMFASLSNYEKQEYYEAHPVMHLITADASYQIQIFAAGVVSLDARVWETKFETQDAFGLWLDAVSSQSQITTNVVPDVSDRVLTLSTCTYGNGDARFVVLGVLVQD